MNENETMNEAVNDPLGEGKTLKLGTHRVIRTPGFYDIHFITDEGCDQLAAYLKKFWARREETMSPQKVDDILNLYRSADGPVRRMPAAKIADLADARADAKADAAGAFKVLEIGSASGGLLYTLKALGRGGNVRLTGVEPSKAFNDDFQAHFPDHRTINADAEAFLKMDAEDFPEAPFDVFYDSVSLCMIAPKTARAVLAKAAEMCREFVIYDYILNGCSKLDTEENAAFAYNTDLGQLYFAHNYRRYCEDLGFKSISAQPVPYPLDGKQGYGILHAASKTD
ncbi:MAG: class I SAM-dependent methyltransferase [Rhodospirillales bacterium]